MTTIQEHLLSASAEDTYVRLAGYEFARRYVEEKSVLNISWDTTGYGASLLVAGAKSVVGLTNSPEAAEHASATYPAPNTTYQSADLPRLSHPDGSFDVVVALGVVEPLESPEELVREAKRVLKPDGVLVVSARDKGADTVGSGSRTGLYAAEFQDLLEHNFRNVRVCRQGTVAGALTLEDGTEPEALPVRSAHFSQTSPAPGEALPVLRHVIAACSDAEIPQKQGQPRLLLDLDHRAFEENEDLSEGVELLRDEVRRMQESEAQSFQDTLALRGSETAYFKAKLRRSEARLKALEAQNENLNRRIENLKKQLNEIQNSRTWRLLGLYRDLRTRMKS